MAFKPTKHQKNAISADGQLLVSAAAGSGKTAVLVERVIRKICDAEHPVPADRFLIVTFTNAAAFELRARLENRLNEEIAKFPENRFLLKQQQLLAGASIGTIDSFCIKLIRNYFNVLGISPDFKIIDDNDFSTLKQQVIDEIFEDCYNNDENFTKFLDAFGSDYGDGNAAAAVISLYDYTGSLTFIEEFFNNSKRLYETDKPYGVWLKYLNDKHAVILRDYLNKLDACINKAANDEILSEKYLPALDGCRKIAVQLVGLLSEGEYESIRLFIEGCSIPDFKRVTGPVDLELKEQCSDIKKAFSKEIASLKKIFSKPLDIIKKECDNVYEVVAKLIDLTKKFDEALFERLNEDGFLTYNYTERLALKLLVEYNDGVVSKAPTADEIISAYDEIMVDEYQDTNDLQDMLFNAISDNGKKLFVVGDIKQCIYRFRGANPENFKNKQLSYDNYNEQNKNKNTAQKIFLTNNFRSRPEICGFINYFFQNLMSENVGSIGYSEDQRLNSSSDFPANDQSKVELHLLDVDEQEENTIEAEARYVASYIDNLLKAPAFLKDKNGSLRCAEYKDFAVFLRSDRGRSDIYSKALADLNIPSSKGKSNPLQSSEVVTLISLLKAADNLSDDISLASALLSPFFGFSADELTEIRLNSVKTLYSGLLALSNTNVKCKNVVDYLKRIRLLSSSESVGAMVSDILDFSGYREIAASLPSGKRRRSNILFFENLAAEFDKGEKYSLTSFLKYIDRIKDSFQDKSTPDQNENCVKIMSMHSSKGLQFPVCIIAQNSAEFNTEENKNITAFNDKLGIGLRFTDSENEVKINTIPKMCINIENRRQQLSEEMRLYYVALTRAEEKLVMILSDKKMDNMLKRAANALKFGELGEVCPEITENANGFGDWILAAALNHPSANELRTKFGLEDLEQNDACELKIIRSNAASAAESATASEFSFGPSVEIIEEINRRFAFKYPYDELRTLEAKTSVSELVKKDAQRYYEFSSRPAFASHEALNSAQKGTAMHKFMQFADYLKARANLKEEIERLYEWNFLSREEADSLSKEEIIKFLHSSLMDRMLASEKMLREQRFLLEIPACEIDKSLSPELSGEKVVVQGAVDCIFFEDDGIVVVDFKTDRINDDDVLSSLYKEQLSYYAKACETIYGRSVKQCFIYSLYMGKEILIERT